jgi:lipoate-protein ligase B
MTTPGWYGFHMGVMAYPEALTLQRRLVEAMGHTDAATGVLDVMKNATRRAFLSPPLLECTGALLMLEHPPVFTLGNRGGLENLRVSRSFLENKGISVIQTERGGNITYHGPGQLILYPIIDLKFVHMSVTDYVEALETVMIQTAAEWGIIVGRNPAGRGVWVGNAKLGSIGIRVRRTVAFHGMALNVSVSLAPFDWINPCGLSGIRMTSMAQETGQDISMSTVSASVHRHVETTFGIPVLML